MNLIRDSLGSIWMRVFFLMFPSTDIPSLSVCTAVQKLWKVIHLESESINSTISDIQPGENSLVHFFASFTPSVDPLEIGIVFPIQNYNRACNKEY